MNTAAGTGDSARGLVERDAELEALIDWATEANAGDGHLVVVTAEAGGGKSVLLDAFEAIAPISTWHVGYCDSLFADRPLEPFFDVLPRSIFDTSDLFGPNGGRDRVFTAVLDWVETIDTFHIIVIEDVHWADEATLDLLRLVARRIATRPVLLVVTCRDIGGDLPDRVSVVLGDLVRLTSTRRLELAPLTEAGCARLCAGTPWDPAHLRRLTGGNPFFVTEVLTADEGSTSPSVRDVIRARVSSMTVGSRRAAEVSALVGYRIDRSLGGRLAALTADAERELRRSGILVEDERGLRFRHEITRQAIIEEMPALRRVELHRQILDVLPAAGVDDHARLAFHAEGADDRSACLDHSRRAASVAMRMGSVSDAVNHLERAISACEGDAAVDAGLHDELADALGLLDRFDDSQRARQQATAAWDELGETTRAADSLRRGVWVASAAGDMERAFDDCRRAIAMMEPVGASAELAAAHAAMARLHGFADDAAAARVHVRSGLLLADQFDLRSLRAELLNIEACCLAMLGREWEDVMADSLAVSRSIPDHPLTARANYNTFHLRMLESRLADAEQIYVDAVAHADEHVLETYSRGFRRLRVSGLVQMGRWDEAIEQADLDDGSADSSPVLGIEPRLAVATIAARRGDPRPLGLLDEAVGAAEFIAQSQFLVPVRIARAEVAWLGNDVGSAWKELELARDLEPTQIHLRRDIELWAHRTGLDASSVGLPGPAALEIDGRPDEAAREWDRRSCPYDAALALLGSDDDVLLQSAVRRLDALGATATAQMARAKMRSLGHGSIPARPHASTRTHPKGLTRREREVLGLLADGLRNKEIAARLYLSPKTVAVHVSRILSKLGVLHRGEAAAWARSHPDA